MNQTQQICQQVIDTAITLANQGFLAGTGGNLALRIDAETFAITPSASDYYTMTADEISVLKLADLSQLAGSKPASVEKGLHAKVLLAFPDCQASIHTHQPIASAFTLLNQALTISDAKHRTILGNQVPIAGYAPSGTSWLANNVARLLHEDTHACLMRNHGVICWGKTVEEACQVVTTLEKAAREWFQNTLHTRTSRSNPALIDQIQQALAG
ncbi:class II aldolase/adducin family protein [Gynuella sp.]|uniref:class II aldolase/adducin family protein n=1 Tax=Gynuella sp. TaxID=2969146 RepID=UPI003D0DC085